MVYVKQTLKYLIIKLTLDFLDPAYHLTP